MEPAGGWSSGPARWGGHRSILARRDGDRIKERINGVVKFREAFRPFAPAVLEEDVTNYSSHAAPSPTPTCCAPRTSVPHGSDAPDSRG
ncbi:MAG TPA: carbamoyltransferase C-terminal domain-containing protein [Actinomycetospora sp.]|nr:carbamoyltransferase C-terminal domain-containing protein [Actinomycetospora sp.]